MSMDEALLAELSRALGDRVLSHEADDVPTIVIRASDLLAVVTILRDDEALAYRYLTDLFGMHYPAEGEAAEQLGLQVLLYDMPRGRRLRVTCRVPIAAPEVSSLTSLFPAANWLERETYDFFGLRFTGHPNLKRILNIETMTAFPMRKDFPLEDQTREDKDDRMFGR
jgi:NADH-quinone oxidoreductase subunit C